MCLRVCVRVQHAYTCMQVRMRVRVYACACACVWVRVVMCAWTHMSLFLSPCCRTPVSFFEQEEGAAARRKERRRSSVEDAEFAAWFGVPARENSDSDEPAEGRTSDGAERNTIQDGGGGGGRGSAAVEAGAQDREDGSGEEYGDDDYEDDEPAQQEEKVRPRAWRAFVRLLLCLLCLCGRFRARIMCPVK